MMEVNNNTRMLDFRGYTPNEINRVSEQKTTPVAPAMQSFVPMGNLPTNNIVNMQPKKKFTRMIHVRVEVVKNIKNAAEEINNFLNFL